MEGGNGIYVCPALESPAMWLVWQIALVLAAAVAMVTLDWAVRPHHSVADEAWIAGAVLASGFFLIYYQYKREH